MNILINNDDGISSEGLITLADVLSEDNNVYIVAPSSNRSGFAHSVSFHKEVEFSKCKVANKYDGISSGGTPIDCIKFGFQYYQDVKFDLVMSGVNLGNNLGTDVFYSATVASCLEGNILGVPSIAVSYCDSYNFDKRTITKVVRKIMSYLGDKLDKLCAWNVNIPNIPYESIKGYKVTKLGIMKYTDIYLENDGKYKLVGAPKQNVNEDKDCDVEWLNEGYVTITPISYEKTNIALLEKYRGEIQK